MGGSKGQTHQSDWDGGPVKGLNFQFPKNIKKSSWIPLGIFTIEWGYSKGDILGPWLPFPFVFFVWLVFYSGVSSAIESMQKARSFMQEGKNQEPSCFVTGKAEHSWVSDGQSGWFSMISLFLHTFWTFCHISCDHPLILVLVFWMEQLDQSNIFPLIKITANLSKNIQNCTFLPTCTSRWLLFYQIRMVSWNACRSSPSCSWAHKRLLVFKCMMWTQLLQQQKITDH